ncbi:LysR substrate-binding domain-containing protein, partial [Herbaspirillum lusitanum]|uniref:LysR substrate-binding domain-containing protein n=1 Tax=Herbaspirillum lusitanum TaxID=213312 RepID=UPI0003786418
AGGAPQRAGIVSEAIGSETIVPLCSPALLRDKPDALTLADIADMTLIQSTLNPVRWSDWFALNGMKLPPGRPMPSFDRASLALAAAVNSVGIALESTRLAEQEIANGELVRLDGGELKSVLRETHFLSYREGEKNSKKIMRFRDWLFLQAGLNAELNQA